MIKPNFGQKEGDEDMPLTGDGAVVVPDDILMSYELEQKKKSRKGATEKDLEQQRLIYTELETEYTADGRLKNKFYDEMKELIGWRKIELEEEDGRKYVIEHPDIDDYGMVGITNSLTMTGIAGLYPSNVFTTDYLPQKFKEHAHFYATDVGQSIDSSGWTTTIEGRMVWRYVTEKPDE